MVGWSRLHGQLVVHHGVVNTGIIQAGQRALLIDCGSGHVEATLRELGVEQVDGILFTHHHRDQASGVASAAARGAWIGVPEAEAWCYNDVGRYWDDPARRWHLYDSRPHSLMLAESVPVHRTFRHGDTLRWGPATISVLGTPGHTDGSVSYLVKLDGDSPVQRVVFCGDLLYGEGQVWDLHSLQKGVLTRDYHGFMGDRGRLATSLAEVRRLGADLLVPSHGPVVVDPVPAIDLVCDRLERLYGRYVAISALRYYFPELFAEHDALAEGMPFGHTMAYPDFVHHLGTTWVIQSESGAACVVDCGSAQVIHDIHDMQAAGTLGPVEWLWVTHYHDDHVDAIPEFIGSFRCPIVADEHVAQIVECPLAWRLPCISPASFSIDRRTTHGESWQWHEFRVTTYHLPGQTLYHGGLMVEGRGARILFAGDSFTPSGIDDYCPGNRNWLGSGVGFDACLALVEELQPDCILNCHVDTGFRFTKDECRLMRANLAERQQLLADLLPWDHPNYGLDAQWVRCHPYEQQVAAGGTARLDAVVTNHSAGTREARCRPVPPRHWGPQVGPQQAKVSPGTERRIPFRLAVPRETAPGRYVIQMDVTYDGHTLGPLCEAVLVVTPSQPEAAPCT